MLDIAKTELFITEICKRIGQDYGGYHTISSGNIDGENCPQIAFHVGAEKKNIMQSANGEEFEGTGIVYRILVGSNISMVYDDQDEEIGLFKDITKGDLFGEVATKKWWQFWK